MKISLRPAHVLASLSLLALCSIIAFMTWNAHDRWDFILPFRSLRLAALVLVGYSVAVSTVLFQTVSNNRILTPSIMGFDSLYLFIQTVFVFLLGSFVGSAFPSLLLFFCQVIVMAAFGCLLYGWMLTRGSHSLHLLLLVGIVFGFLFRGASSLMQRMIDPNDFVVLQDRFFASFNVTDTRLLAVSGVIVLMVSLFGLRYSHFYDVLALGRETATSLGVSYRRTVTGILVIITILVSVSTALVGPITFLGLIVANLAYHLARTFRHRVILAVAVLLSIIFLVSGQMILEHCFAFNSALSIIIEFIGGLFFIGLLVKGVSQ